MAYTSTKTGKWRVDIADSLDDIVQFGETESAPHWKQQRWSRDSAFQHADIQTRSFGEAVDLARKGWPDGRKRLSQSLDVAKFIRTSSNHRAETLDVAGAYPIVPAFIAGAPDCMVNVGEEERKTKPIFRFMVAGFISCGVSGETIMRRGAAILSWVDKLEAEGARCEIVYIMTCTGSGVTDKYTIATTVKRADEHLDLDRAAFMLAHPSMFRRVAFACYEQHADINAMTDAYGTPSDDIPDSLKTSHSVYFPAMSWDAGDKYRTSENADKEITRIITEGLQHSDLPGA